MTTTPAAPTTSTTPTISMLTAAEVVDATGELAVLLADAVDGGASVGFLAPADMKVMTAWWEGAVSSCAESLTSVWAARDADGTLIGTVQLRRSSMPNGRHRGEIAKLLVDRRARGCGLGRELLAAAEGFAVEAGISLLFLDTETGSAAEHLYESSGWTRSGVIPDYATTPAGVLHPTTIFFKRLP